MKNEMPKEIWANNVRTWSPFPKPANNKGELKNSRKCAPRIKYIRADLVPQPLISEDA